MPYPAEEFINRADLIGASSDLDLMLAKNKSQEAEKMIWLSVSEVAKLGGLSTKTVRRAIESNQLKFKVINNRYQISLGAAIKFFLSTPKLLNKFNQDGMGRWVEKWRIE